MTLEISNLREEFGYRTEFPRRLETSEPHPCIADSLQLRGGGVATFPGHSFQALWCPLHMCWLGWHLLSGHCLNSCENKVGGGAQHLKTEQAPPPACKLCCPLVRTGRVLEEEDAPLQILATVGSCSFWDRHRPICHIC